VGIKTILLKIRKIFLIAITFVLVVPCISFAGNAGLQGFQASDWDASGSNIYIGKNGVIYKSTDHGANFSSWYTVEAATCDSEYAMPDMFFVLFIPTRVGEETTDTMFFSTTCSDKLYRISDLTAETPTASVVIENIGSEPSKASALFFSFTEDSQGNLYTGFYALSNSTGDALIYKSTNRGANWTQIKSFASQHIHAVKVNPYNNWLYAITGEDYNFYYEDSHSVFRSKDGGATWARVFNGHDYWGANDHLILWSIGFSGTTVYLGKDIPSDGEVFRFTDDGSSEPFTITSVYSIADPLTGGVPDISNLSGTLFYTSSSEGGSVTTRAMTSTNGTDWTTLNTAAVTVKEVLGSHTAHAGRYNRTFYSLSSTTGYYYDFTDEIAPTLSSATIGTNGTTLTLVFSEVVDNYTGFSVSPSNTMTYVSGDGTNTLVFTLTTKIEHDATVTISYTAGNVVDQAGTPNALATINGEAITNNTAEVVNGSCGTADGDTFSSTPSTNLCTTGTAGSVTLASTTYSWDCVGSGGGTTDNCTATYQAAAPVSLSGGVISGGEWK